MIVRAAASAALCRLAFGAALALAGARLAATDATALELSIPEIEIPAGATVEAPVKSADARGLAALQISVRFDGAAFEVGGVRGWACAVERLGRLQSGRRRVQRRRRRLAADRRRRRSADDRVSPQGRLDRRLGRRPCGRTGVERGRRGDDGRDRDRAPSPHWPRGLEAGAASRSSDQDWSPPPSQSFGAPLQPVSATDRNATEPTRASRPCADPDCGARPAPPGRRPKGAAHMTS